MAIGCWTSGSAAKSVARNPAGRLICAAACAAGIGPPGDFSVSNGAGNGVAAIAAPVIAVRHNVTETECDRRRWMIMSGIDGDELKALGGQTEPRTQVGQLADSAASS